MNATSMKAALAITSLETESFISPAIMHCSSAAEAVQRLEQMRKDIDVFIENLKVVSENDEARNAEVKSIMSQLDALEPAVQLVMSMGAGNYQLTLKLLEQAEKTNDGLMKEGKWDNEPGILDLALGSKTDFPKAKQLLKQLAAIDGITL
jgi:hypothetical protein